MEGVFQCHRVIVGSLVLCAHRGVKRLSLKSVNPTLWTVLLVVYLVCSCLTDLVPRVRSVRRVDEDGDDLGFGQKSRSPLSSHFRVKVVGTLLKVVVWTGVGGQREVLHIPNTPQTQTYQVLQAALLIWTNLRSVDKESVSTRCVGDRPCATAR